MAILSEAEARALAERILKMSKAESTAVTVAGNARGNVRTARNAVSTAGTRSDRSVAVTAIFGKKSGTATANQFDDATLERCVRRAEELARLAPEDPEFMPLLGAQPFRPVNCWSESTAKLDPAERANAAAQSIRAAKEGGCVTAGYLEDTTGWYARANSTGMFGYHRFTNVEFSVSMRTEDETGSGYAERDQTDYLKLGVESASRIAVEKARASREAKALEPGKYTVILEPPAVADLIRLIAQSMDARAADEGRSFLSKAGGATRLGEKLVDERFTMYSDPTDPDVPVASWSPEGQPRGRIDWIRGGVVNTMSRSRYWAQKTGKDAVPGPGNLIVAGGTQTIDELVRGTERGILVTRLWYIRPVDPQTLLYTGLTRDGTFYIENGKVRHAVKNFRFNESPIIMLNNLDALGVPMRVQGSEGGGGGIFGGQLGPGLLVKMPTMRIRDFTFTSLSDAV